MRKILAALAIGLAFTSCVPSTPQSRIEREPAKFSALSRKEQSLVQEGQIARGMSPDAVILAWGNPAQRYEGSKNSHRTERWDYLATRPVYSSSFFGGYGYSGRGYGPYGGYGPYSSFDYGYGPEITYIPYRSASVQFVNNQVDSWERIR